MLHKEAYKEFKLVGSTTRLTIKLQPVDFGKAGSVWQINPRDINELQPCQGNLCPSYSQKK